MNVPQNRSKFPLPSTTGNGRAVWVGGSRVETNHTCVGTPRSNGTPDRAPGTKVAVFAGK